LDAASEGLLLFTNDTEWANKRLETNESKQWLVVGKQGRGDGGTKRPKHTKTYRVQVAGQPSSDELKQMEAGFKVPPRVFGEPEEFMHAVSAKLHSAGEKNCWLEIVLDEGKNREIRRMLAHLGYEVMRLVRIKFCGYELGNLKPGEIRVLPQNLI
ncbi:MAG: pseudouridine synthase, partial [Fibrobacter sp.]|nr:pseudouridine synthase [Fibrobacter sp.]